MTANLTASLEELKSIRRAISVAINSGLPIDGDLVDDIEELDRCIARGGSHTRIEELRATFTAKV